MEYPYTQRDLLKEKETYQYTSYHGQAFLDAHGAQRRSFLEKTPMTACAEPPGNLWAFLKDFAERGWQREILPDQGFALLLKRFEVTKRLWTHVDENFRPQGEAEGDCLNLYILFSYGCLLSYEKTRHLSFLNALLKSNDIIASQTAVACVDRGILEKVISGELQCIQELRKAL
ncbi:MAG: hypothetical protein LBJ70_02335 [Holosporales bacterium]|jgi:hypothetical protein|nr:hypothetical protein [Holosporales bacterium]